MKTILQKIFGSRASSVLFVSGTLVFLLGVAGVLLLEPSEQSGVLWAAFAVGVGLVVTALEWALFAWQRHQLTILVQRTNRDRERVDSTLQALIGVGDDRIRGALMEVMDQVPATNLNRQTEHAPFRIGERLVESSIRDLKNEHALELSAVKLACLIQTARLADHLDDCRGVFTIDELDLLGGGIEKLDSYLVAWIYSRNEAFGVLPLNAKRKLYRFLRERGYWKISTEILESIVEDTKTERDQLAVQKRRSELAVFGGVFIPRLCAPVDDYRGVPGHVMHMVGKALPKTQTGYTLRTHYTAQAQRDTGLSVSVACQVGESGLSDDLQIDYVGDIPYYGLPGAPRNKSLLAEWLQDNVDQLAQLVLRVRPSLLHAHSDFLNGLIANAVGHHFGIPVVYESRGFWEESWISRTAQKYDIGDWAADGRHLGLPEAYVLRQRMEEKVRSESDHVTTLARVMLDHIVDGGLDSTRVSIVPNAVNAEEFPTMLRDSVTASALGIEPDDVVLGYISSIVEYEGIDTLIEAYGNLRAEGAGKLRLLIVGDGQFLSDLREQVAERQLEGVIFTGRVPHEEILSYYSCIDLFVVPRRPAEVCQLVTPLKPFEAFSTGRAVVMSDVGALQEIASDSQAAELFKAGNAGSLANTLRRLIDDKSGREELAAKGAAWVRSERSWAANAEKYLEIFAKLGVSTETSGQRVAEGGAIDVGHA